jgi:hypothetical protein
VAWRLLAVKNWRNEEEIEINSRISFLTEKYIFFKKRSFSGSLLVLSPLKYANDEKLY